MESPLDVLSRAATMVQDNASETRLSSKELPTTAWRRERRLRTGEYHHLQHHQSIGSTTTSASGSSPNSPPPPTAHVQHSTISSGNINKTNINMRSKPHHISIMMAAAASMCPISESINQAHSPTAEQVNFAQMSRADDVHKIHTTQNDDVPLDMSVGNLKERNSPPPPYREPLPGSQYSSSLARPSVITQAPPKRENVNHSCESIDEHFRRSLGKDYFSIFSKRSVACQSTASISPQSHNSQPPTAHIKTLSPTLPSTYGSSSLLPQPALVQPELILPPAYPGNMSAGNHQENSQQAHQNQALAIPRAQKKSTEGPNSPPLPLVVRPIVQKNHQRILVLENPASVIPIMPLTTAPEITSTQTSTSNTNVSRTASPFPLQQQSSGIVVTLSHLASLDNSPSSSPCHTPPFPNIPTDNASANLITTLNIKTEPGLKNVKSTNPTPPASPTLTAYQNINSNSLSNSPNLSLPSSPQTTSFKASTNPSNTSAEVLASVDDHFAKALGDTWKKLQESKEMRK